MEGRTGGEKRGQEGMGVCVGGGEARDGRESEIRREMRFLQMCFTSKHFVFVYSTLTQHKNNLTPILVFYLMSFPVF